MTGRMLAAAAMANREVFKQMVEECRKRGIDPVKAAAGELERQDRAWRGLWGRR